MKKVLIKKEECVSPNLVPRLFPLSGEERAWERGSVSPILPVCKSCISSLIAMERMIKHGRHRNRHNSYVQLDVKSNALFLSRSRYERARGPYHRSLPGFVVLGYLTSFPYLETVCTSGFMQHRETQASVIFAEGTPRRSNRDGSLRCGIRQVVCCTFSTG